MCIQEIVRVCACTWCGCHGENLVHFCQDNNVPDAGHQLERWEWPHALCWRCQGHEYEHREIVVRPSSEWPFWGPQRGGLAKRFNFARTETNFGRALPPKTLPEQSQIVFDHLVAPPMTEESAASASASSASAFAPFARTDLWDPRDPNAPALPPSRINKIMQMAMARSEPISMDVKPAVAPAATAAELEATLVAAEEQSGERAAASVQAPAVDWADLVEEEEEQEQGSETLGERTMSSLNISAAAPASAVVFGAVPVAVADEGDDKPAKPARQIPIEFPRVGPAPALTTPPIKLALAPSSPSRPASPERAQPS